MSDCSYGNVTPLLGGAGFPHTTVHKIPYVYPYPKLRWANKMAHWITVIVAKPGDVSLTSGTHVVEKEI